MNILHLFGVSTAHAANAAPHSGGFISMLPMLIILVAFMYFLVIRPQSKRAKEHRALVGNLKKGDEVVTSGGLMGKIVKIAENFIVVEVAESVELRLQKNAVTASMPKGTIKSL